MREITLTILVTFLAGQTTVVAGDTEEAVRMAEENWAEAVTSTDFATMKEIYSDDLIYAHSTGVIESKAEYLDKLKTGSQKYDLIDHQKTTIKIFADSAIAHSIVRMKGTSKGQPFDSKLMMLHLWVKQGGKWRLAAHQTTKLEDY